MTRPYFSPVHFLSAILGILMFFPGQAWGSGAFIAVYNSGRAQVAETRVVTLPEGPAAVIFNDIPATLDSTSVRASAPDMAVQDIQYAFHSITAKNLLDAYVGKDLTVILPDPADANARILRQAKLLSNEDRPIFAMGKEIYLGDYEAVLLPEMPKGFDAEPTLTLTTNSSVKGRKNVLLSYLMDGIDWRTDYTMTVGQQGGDAVMDAWATVTNVSGHGFSGADVRLVAGDVRRAESPKLYRSEPMMVMAEGAMDAAPSMNAAEESFSQYHVYKFDRYISLPPNGSKQVNLFSAAGIPVKTELTSRYQTGRSQFSGEMQQSVESALVFRNTKENHLGHPMPAGLIRVFMPTSDGSHLLAGESRISHVADGGEVRLVLGNSFDLNVERVQTQFTRTGKNVYEVGWRITVRNGKGVPQDLKLVEGFSGQWKVLSADTEYVAKDAGTIEFDLKGIQSTTGKQEKVVNYTVRVEY